MSAIRALRIFVLTTALAATFFTTGCKAGRGDTCKEANDCSGSLACCKVSFSPTARGTCEDRVMCPDGVLGSTPVDASSPDSSSADGSVPDGSAPDAADDGSTADAALDAEADAAADAEADAAADAADATTDGALGDASTDASTDA